MIRLAVETKFDRTVWDPGSILSAFRSTPEKLLTSSADDVHVSRRITPGGPSNSRFPIWVTRGDRIRIGVKERAGDRRFSR